MLIKTNAIQNGYFLDKYGKRGLQFKSSMPSYSFGFKVEDLPKRTVSLAFVLDDPDSVPVCGFKWIHWLGANLTELELPDNESIHATTFIQGKNSWDKNMYGGMMPPDKTHTYVFRVYAVDCMLDLKTGFTWEDLKACAPHMIDSACVYGKYKS